MSEELEQFELLLAHADTHQPVLPSGLDEEALFQAPRPEAPSPSKYLRSELKSLDDLPAQRWGLVVPEGPEGARLLKLVAPLRERRQRDQGGCPVQVYCVRPGMDREAAHDWKARVFGSEQVEEEDRPRYLLILGDLDGVSLELQQVLATDSLVGRLAFPADEGYRAYVEKVLRWEDTPASVERARLLLYTSRDGTRATRLGHSRLMEPCFQSSLERQRLGKLRAQPPMQLAEEGGGSGSSVRRFLSFADSAEPAVLLSLSHGLGMPDQRPWASPDEQRALQGALLLPGGEQFTAAEVKSRSFLPGGMWFGLACFSAGTPSRSAYAPWLRELPAVSPGPARAVALLPAEGERPFVAALPQAALANPRGPLVVMGHMDLAWSASFNDQGRDRHSRFLHVIEALAHQYRAGAALAPLFRAANEVGMRLSASYHEERADRDAGRQPRITPAERACLWLLYHDLSSYVLLGDPAVRLPLAGGKAK